MDIQYSTSIIIRGYGLSELLVMREFDCNYHGCLRQDLANLYERQTCTHELEGYA